MRQTGVCANSDQMQPSSQMGSEPFFDTCLVQVTCAPFAVSGGGDAVVTDPEGHMMEQEFNALDRSRPSMGAGGRLSFTKLSTERACQP
jgi:hypothetical protein